MADNNGQTEEVGFWDSFFFARNKGDINAYIKEVCENVGYITYYEDVENEKVLVLLPSKEYPEILVGIEKLERKYARITFRTNLSFNDDFKAMLTAQDLVDMNNAILSENGTDVVCFWLDNEGTGIYTDFIISSKEMLEDLLAIFLSLHVKYVDVTLGVVEAVLEEKNKKKSQGMKMGFNSEAYKPKPETPANDEGIQNDVAAMKN